ncbi:MAG: hypothetical protein LBI06_02675 [Treponema sp.]|jgi:hypothetical protein|nr:hypothetical protein [Treponema sp.]
MGKQFDFGIATYLFAAAIEKASLDDIRHGIEFFEKFCPLDKAYIEPHRGNVDVSPEKIRAVKALFEEHGIEAAGGITTTIQMPGHEKNSIFDTFCYTEDACKKRLAEIVRQTAAMFDEIILDDFYFTACRCEHCIEAKGAKTWAEYRLTLMEDVSRLIVKAAKEANPNAKMIIKYPNWYESYQETGYNPENQKDIFDGIYTGTETRNPKYEQQHLQRYLSYSIVRYLENVSPGRNGGGWIDPFGLSDDISGWTEQAEFTLFAKAREMMLFNFFVMIDSGFLPPLSPRLARLDAIAKQCGKPQGVSLYEPYNADGEDQVANYLGMAGIPFEPSPEFVANGDIMFLPLSAAKDEGIIPKLEQYVRQGNTAVITAGFLKECMNRGITDMTSARPAGKTISGSEYWVEPYRERRLVCRGAQAILIEALDYKTNASWCEIAMIRSHNSFPLLIHDFYGKGNLYILNMPNDFGDLYQLPTEAIGHINRVFSGPSQPWIKTSPRACLFRYDNGIIGIYSQKPYADDVDIFLPENYSLLSDLETGAEIPLASGSINDKRYGKPLASFKTARVYLAGGSYRFFRMG